MICLGISLARFKSGVDVDYAARSEINLIVGEISNGSWFIISLAMWITLGAMILGRARRMGFAAFLRDLWSQQEIGLQMGIAFFVWLTASMMRAGYIWLLLASEGSHNPAAIRFARSLDASYNVMIVAALVAFAGGLCCLRVFGRDGVSRWMQTWTWVATGVAAVVVPIAVHLFLR